MHIKDHNDAMTFFKTYDSVASKGKWKEFIDEMEFDSMLQEPRTMAQEPRNMYAGGQLVQNTADGSRPGYAGRPRGFNLKDVETVVNNANNQFKYITLDNLAKQIDGVKGATHLEGIIKNNKLNKLDSYAIKVEKAFIELFKDSGRNADEVIKPLYKIADMIGVSGGKERVRIENISNALKKSKILNYAEDVKPLINKLSNANFIKKIEGKEWIISDVESSIRSKSMLRSPKTDVEHLMNYVVRHQDQAGGDAVFNIFDKNNPKKRITNMADVDSYHDIFFKDSKGKVYDMDYLLRNSKTDPMFKEYYNIQDQLLEMKNKKYWPDGSKIIDSKTGKHVTFGNYSGSMHQHGYGWKKPYERFAYETDHLNLKKHPFKNLTILPQRINIAVGAADRLKKPDIKYKLGGEHFRNLNVDDLMMQEKALGEKILIFDKEGTHIGKKLKTPYTAAKIKVDKPITVPKAVKPGGGVQLSSGFGALDDLVKSPGAKKIGTIARKTLLSDLVWPEIALGGAEYINRLQKGQTDRAKGETLKLMSLGLYDSGATEEAVLEQAKKLGYGEKDIKALENLMRYNKLGKKIKDYEGVLKRMGEGDVDIESEMGNYALVEEIKDLKQEQESVAGFYFGAIGDKDVNYGTEIYNDAVTALGNEEFNRTLEDRLGRRDPYAGGIGNWLQNKIFTLDARGRTAEQERIDAMSPQELREFNVQRGVLPVGPTHGAYDRKKFEDLEESLGYMYADGGLAGLMKKYYD